MADGERVEDSEETDGKVRAREKKTGQVLIKIFVYITVALVFVIMMVIVSVLTDRVLHSGDRESQLKEISSDFTMSNPVYTYYDQIPDIRTRTADRSPRSVVVSLELGFDSDENMHLSEELTKRKPQLTDLFRKYFSRRTAQELSIANEDRVKEELKNMVNELLKNGEIKEVVFTDYQVLDF